MPSSKQKKEQQKLKQVLLDKLYEAQIQKNDPNEIKTLKEVMIKVRKVINKS